MVTDEYRPISGRTLEEEQARAKVMEVEYEKYQKEQEAKKRKKKKQEEELESLRKQIEQAKKGEITRKEFVAKQQEKARLQKELSELKMARYKAVGQNIKGIFSNIGQTFGKVGGAVMGQSAQQSQTATTTAKVIQKRAVQHPVRQQVQQAMQPAVQKPIGFQMPDFDAILKQSGVAMDDLGGMPQQPSYAPSVKAKMQIRRKTKLKKRMKGALQKKGRITIPKIRRIPRSPTVVPQQKPFNINDVIRGMPQ